MVEFLPGAHLWCFSFFPCERKSYSIMVGIHFQTLERGRYLSVARCKMHSAITRFVRFSLRSNLDIRKRGAVVQSLNFKRYIYTINCLNCFQNIIQTDCFNVAKSRVYLIFNSLDLPNCPGQRYVVHVKNPKIQKSK